MPRETQWVSRDTLLCFSVMMVLGTIVVVVEEQKPRQIFEMLTSALLFTLHYALCFQNT